MDVEYAVSGKMFALAYMVHSWASPVVLWQFGIRAFVLCARNLLSVWFTYAEKSSSLLGNFLHLLHGVLGISLSCFLVEQLEVVKGALQFCRVSYQRQESTTVCYRVIQQTFICCQLVPKSIILICFDFVIVQQFKPKCKSLLEWPFMYYI
jgi:hypothetical protein